MSYLCFLCNIKYKLEFLRYSQVFLWRLLLTIKRKVSCCFFFTSTETYVFLLTQKQEAVKQEAGGHLTMGSDTSGTMLHWILQPLKNRKKNWMKLGHQTTLKPLKLVSNIFTTFYYYQHTFARFMFLCGSHSDRKSIVNICSPIAQL